MGKETGERDAPASDDAPGAFAIFVYSNNGATESRECAGPSAKWASAFQCLPTLGAGQGFINTTGMSRNRLGHTKTAGCGANDHRRPVPARLYLCHRAHCQKAPLRVQRTRTKNRWQTKASARRMTKTCRSFSKTDRSKDGMCQLWASRGPQRCSHRRLTTGARGGRLALQPLGQARYHPSV